MRRRSNLLCEVTVRVFGSDRESAIATATANAAAVGAAVAEAAVAKVQRETTERRPAERFEATGVLRLLQEEAVRREQR